MKEKETAPKKTKQKRNMRALPVEVNSVARQIMEAMKVLGKKFFFSCISKDLPYKETEDKANPDTCNLAKLALVGKHTKEFNALLGKGEIGIFLNKMVEEHNKGIGYESNS